MATDHPNSPAPDAPPPRRLPRGPHSLPREVVIESQRRRLTDAIVEVVARKGYPATTVADILREAGVSRLTFYDLFSSKEECFLAAYQEGAGVHYRLVLAAIEDIDRPLEQLRAGLTAYLDVLMAKPAFASTFLLEATSAGPRALELHDRFRERYVELLRQVHGALRREFPRVPELSDPVLRATAAAVDALVVDRLHADGEMDREALRREALYVMLSLLAVPAAQRRVAAVRAVAGPA